MHLDSGAFLAVFAVFFAVYALAPAMMKRVLLVVGSVAFYATLNLRFVPLFLALGVFTFLVTDRLHRATSPARRDRLLWLGVGANVLVLAFFKTAVPVSTLIAWSAPGPARLLAFAVPLGMSFYTLQAISYVVDVHRKLYQPPRSILSFLASYTLFPQLLSGPIVRSSFLVPLVEKVDLVGWETARRAMFLFVVGLSKKALADRLAPAADAAFDAVHPISAVAAWTGLIAYSAQLYGDFSGYTDMATGLALLLGVDLPPNFRLPYLATSPADFWRRWHISLSSWLRDYIFLPLGLRLRRRRHAAILATWLLAGLWHGVSWVFVVYGLYHGVLLVVNDVLARRFDDEDDLGIVRRVAQTAFTFYLVLVGYVIFRSRTVGAALGYLAALHASRVPSVVSRDAAITVVASLLAIVFGHVLDHVVARRRPERSALLWPAMVLAVTGIMLFGGAAQPFVYFQF